MPKKLLLQLSRPRPRPGLALRTTSLDIDIGAAGFNSLQVISQTPPDTAVAG